MAALLYLASYITCGCWCVRWLLPRQRLACRLWLGSCLGVLLMMWLPALLAFIGTFSLGAHVLALIPLTVLTAACWYLRDQGAAPAAWGADDRRLLPLLLALAVPFTVLGVYLQWTHVLRPIDGALYVGQSTYGDLPLHMGIATSLRDAHFPADYSILPGQRLAYPFLADSFATSFMLLGMSLRGALVWTGSIMMALVFCGLVLLMARLAARRRAAALAFLLIALNGGLGFLYSLDMLGVSLGAPTERSLQYGTWLDRLNTILTGWYQTPVNHAEFNTYNLRWSNIIADMFVPQRTFLGGWVILLPCLYLLYDSLKAERRRMRPFVLLAVMAGGLPLLHTHSFLALGMASAGWLLWDVLKRRLSWHWLFYGLITMILAAPQLLAFTFGQAGGGHFLRLQFNWVNNLHDAALALKDGYLWFYLKNIGLPFLLLILTLFEKNEKHRHLFAGAFVIFVIAECVLFQPNEYDNNKLFYVWYVLCAVPVAEYAWSLWDRLQGLRARRLMGALAAIVLFLSGSLSLARECVSQFQLFAPADVAASRFVEENTPPHSTFLTGTQHINPISALSGRTIVCGPDLWLYYHGFDLQARKQAISDFYAAPAAQAPVLRQYGVDYILVGPHERAQGHVDENKLAALFPAVYRDEANGYFIYQAREQAP